MGPSGEATAHSSGNTPPIPFISLVINLYMYIFFNISSLILTSFFWSISCADESESETEVRVETKEEEDLGILRSWMQVGGIPALDEGEARRLLQKAGSSFPFLTSFGFVFLFPQPIFTHVVLYFQGLGLLRRVSTMKEEAHRLEMAAQEIDTRGLEKVEVAVAGSKVEGHYGLLRGVMSHPSISTSSPPHKKACHTPSTTISHLPPQRSTGTEISGPTVDIPEQSLGVASPAVPPVSEETLPTDMQPLCIQLGGVLSGCINSWLKVAERVHQPHMLLFVCMCTRCTWQWGWCVPLAANPFSTQTHLNATKRVMLICK